jgi:hypothetical protein
MEDTISEHFQPSLKELSELEKLTRAYGKFSYDAVGLGHVLGGGLIFLSAYLLAPSRHIHLGVFNRLLLGAGPYAWIFGKEWLREHYYQFSGRVQQPRRWGEGVLLGILTGVTALCVLTATGFVIYNLLQDFSWGLALTSLAYVTLLLPMPFMVWRYLRAPYEFVVGASLLALSAIYLSGTPLAPHGNWRLGIAYMFVLLALPVALVMVWVGLDEHMEFLKLRRKMRAMKEAA